jgi:drug/metabolite transporter (DMT)-like permease
MKTDQLPLQLLRGFVSALYLWVLIYSFAHMPFADATAISYTQAAYIVLAFSALILNERVTTLRWIATAIGTVGALLIIKPAFLDRNVVYLAVLLGTSLKEPLQKPAASERDITCIGTDWCAWVGG